MLTLTAERAAVAEQDRSDMKQTWDAQEEKVYTILRGWLDATDALNLLCANSAVISFLSTLIVSVWLSVCLSV